MDSAQQNISSLIQNDDLLETKLKSFVKNLQDLGLNEEQVNTLTLSVATTATKQTLAKISALMNEEDFNKWKEFVDTGANNAQQLIVLNRLLQNKTNKDLETLNAEIIDSLIKDTLNEVTNMKDLTIKVSQLSPEEVAKAKSLLDSGDYDGVDKVINRE
ncbi:MAG: hypothetical protein AB9915_03680 [Candidatus Dojkabacteria bacterium]